MKNVLLGFAVLAVALLSGCKHFPSREVEADTPPKPAHASIAAIKHVGYPQQGVLLAQGWDSLRQTPANNICVVFGESVVPGHDIDIRFSEIFSREQLNKAMSLAASASYSGFGASISAQANFSNSLSIDRTNQNILATIEVLKGDQFVSPSLGGVQTDPVTRAREGFDSIQLTDQARALLRAGNLRAFQSMCGDSFVYHIRRGGKLHAYLTFSDLAREARDAMSFSLSASGWGASISGNQSVEQVKKNQDKITNIRIFQSGGPLQPAPINTTEFYQTVRQFLTTSDPDLFPTKPFEIGLVRYDTLPNWDSSLQVTDPEGLRDLITLYWLFDDLRKQYTNALTSSDQFLMFQPESWDKGSNSYFVFLGGPLCKVTYDGTKWNSLQKECAPGEADVVGDNPWALSNILARLDSVVGHGKQLRLAIEQCLVDPARCNEVSALAAVRASVQRGMKTALGTSIAKDIDGAMKRKKISMDAFQQIVAATASLPATATLAEVRARFSQSSKFFSNLDTQGKAEASTLVERILNNQGGPREAIVAAKAMMIQWSLQTLAKSDQDHFASAGLRTFFADDEPETSISITDKAKEYYVKEYYKAAILSPIRIYKANSTHLQDEFQHAYSTSEVTINANAAQVRDAIRKNIVLEQIRFSESYCSVDGGSALCKPVTWIRQLMDETEIGPIFAQSSRQRTVVVGKVRRCEEGWFSRNAIWWKSCWDEAVTQSVTDFITEFADTRVRL